MERIRPHEFIILIDETSQPGVTYIGRARVAAEVDRARGIWQIQKIDETGAVYEITFAEGNIKFDKKWSERLTLNYTNII